MKVRDLIERIRLGEIALPEFQREYVWEAEQAQKLLQSLYKGYPTGSLLFWDTMTSPATKQAKDILREADQEGAQPGSRQQIILDGQQRLTVLYLLTQGEAPPYYHLDEIEHDPRVLCFDLIAGVFRLPHTDAARPPALIPVPQCLRDELDTVAIARAVVGMHQGEALNRVVTRCVNNLSQLRSILDYDYPVQVVPVSATLDEAIDVFDRVNSSGTKLTPAELALTHISGKWPQARQTMKAQLDQLSAQHLHLDLDFLVRSLAGVVSHRADFAELHYLPAETLQQGWERLSATLTALIPTLLRPAFISGNGYLSSVELLIPPVVYLARNGGAFPSEQVRTRTIYWLYVANMWGHYAHELDQRLAHDLSVVVRSDDPWQELVDSIIQQRGRIDARPSDLEGRGPEHPLFHMVQIVTAAQGATDWETDVPLSGMPQLRTHPLFSVPDQAGADDQLRRKQVDEIANQVLLVSDPATQPLQMLPALAQKQRQILEQHCIPMDTALWRTQSVDAFLTARRDLLTQAINAHLNVFRAASVPSRPVTLTDLRMAGESVTMEYKATLRWDVEKRVKNDDLEQVVVKTIAAFLNTEGGYLLIGVQDDGSIYGIEADFATTDDGDSDWFERHLRGLISSNMGMEHNQRVQVKFAKTDQGTICVVRVARSRQPVFCRHKKDATASSFYIRTGNATNMLPTAELGPYIRNHWKY